MSAWLPFILFAAVIVIGIPAWCWLAPGDDPGNALTHEQDGGGEGAARESW